MNFECSSVENNIDEISNNDKIKDIEINIDDETIYRSIPNIIKNFSNDIKCNKSKTEKSNKSKKSNKSENINYKNNNNPPLICRQYGFNF